MTTELPWFKFSDLLPTASDANDKGEVLARHRQREYSGKMARRYGGSFSLVVVERPCLWDWIPPARHDSTKLWEANDFIEWRPLSAHPTHQG